MDQNNRSILNAIGLIGIVWFFIQGADLFSSHPIIKIASAITSIAIAVLGAILIVRMNRIFKNEREEFVEKKNKKR